MKRNRYRPQLESLEGRDVPSTMFTFQPVAGDDASVAVNWDQQSLPGPDDYVFIPDHTVCEVTQGLDVGGVFVSNQSAVLKVTSLVHSSGWVMIGQASVMIVTGATVEADYAFYNMGQITLSGSGSTLIGNYSDTQNAVLYVTASADTAYVTGTYNQSGAITFGGTASRLNINGDYTQQSTAVINLPVTAGNPTCSFIDVTGNVTLAGSLVVSPDDTLDGGQKFQVLTWSGSISGAFQETSWDLGVGTYVVSSNDLTLDTLQLVPSP